MLVSVRLRAKRLVPFRVWALDKVLGGEYLSTSTFEPPKFKYPGLQLHISGVP